MSSQRQKESKKRRQKSKKRIAVACCCVLAFSWLPIDGWSHPRCVRCIGRASVAGRFGLPGRQGLAFAGAFRWLLLFGGRPRPPPAPHRVRAFDKVCCPPSSVGCASHPGTDKRGKGWTVRARIPWKQDFETVRGAAFAGQKSQRTDVLSSSASAYIMVIASLE